MSWQTSLQLAYRRACEARQYASLRYVTKNGSNMLTIKKKVDEHKYQNMDEFLTELDQLNEMFNGTKYTALANEMAEYCASCVDSINECAECFKVCISSFVILVCYPCLLSLWVNLLLFLSYKWIHFFVLVPFDIFTLFWLEDDSDESSIGKAESFLTKPCSKIHLLVVAMRDDVGKDKSMWPAKLMAVSQDKAKVDFFGSRKGLSLFFFVCCRFNSPFLFLKNSLIKNCTVRIIQFKN